MERDDDTIHNTYDNNTKWKNDEKKSEYKHTTSVKCRLNANIYQRNI